MQTLSLDERLAQALDFGNQQITAQTQKQNLKTRVKAMLMYSTNGGLFHVSIDLINFIDFMIRRGETELILLDSKDNPIKISNLPEFMEAIVSTYQEVTFEYHLEYQKFRKQRTVSGLVDLK